MKIKGLKDLNNFIEKEVLPNQLKYILFIVGGAVALILMIWFMSPK